MTVPSGDVRGLHMHVRIRRAAVIAGTAAVVLGSAAGMASAGSAPAISWSPAGTFDFGSVTAGTAATTTPTFTLTNKGGSASAALTVTVTGAAFKLQNDTCTGTSLGPRKSCTVQVTYTASTGGGTDTGLLTASGHARVPASASIALTGQAVVAPALTVTNAQDGSGGWGTISGTGLKPGADVGVYGSYPGSSGIQLSGSVDSSGNIAFGDLGLSCGYGWSDVYAVSTTAAGTTITSSVVSSPCG
jgi:hypothetical protein